MTVPPAQKARQQSHSWKVDGMDCGSCAATIRTAIEKLPGVSDVKISVARETLCLAVEPGPTTIDMIETRVRKLGFRPSLQARKSSLQPQQVDACGCGHDHDHGVPDTARPLLDLRTAFGIPPEDPDAHEGHAHALHDEPACCGHDQPNDGPANGPSASLIHPR